LIHTLYDEEENICKIGESYDAMTEKMKMTAEDYNEYIGKHLPDLANAGLVTWYQTRLSKSQTVYESKLNNKNV